MSRKLSIDEISKRKGYNQYVTVISDLENHCLIEVIDSHKAEEIIEMLKGLWTEEERAIAEEVSIDMWVGFAKVIKEVFPNAKTVYNRFHIMKKVIDELDKIRRQSGARGKEAKRLILKKGKDLSEEEKEKLSEYLNRSKRLRQAYEWKERFREIYESGKTVEEKRNKWRNGSAKRRKFTVML